jgi:uncharacterized membrane protein
MSPDVDLLISVFFRWSHIIFGIIWLGQLYFLNLVNVPFQGDLDATAKQQVNPKLLLRAFYWFRMAAMYTFVFGWLLFGFKYFHQKLFFLPEGGVSNRGLWILAGVLLASVMWFNVWFVIWPRQREILSALAKGAPHPEAAALAKTALKASRFNLYASGPMLVFMVVPNNAGHWPLWGVIVAVVIGVGFWFGLVKRSFKIKPTV